MGCIMLAVSSNAADMTSVHRLRSILLLIEVDFFSPVHCFHRFLALFPGFFFIHPMLHVGWSFGESPFRPSSITQHRQWLMHVSDTWKCTASYSDEPFLGLILLHPLRGTHLISETIRLDSRHHPSSRQAQTMSLSGAPPHGIKCTPASASASAGHDHDHEPPRKTAIGMDDRVRVNPCIWDEI